MIWGRGGIGFQGHFGILKRAPKKILGALDGGGEEKSPRHIIPKLHIFYQFFQKTWTFPNQKGTFDVNLVCGVWGENEGQRPELNATGTRQFRGN